MAMNGTGSPSWSESTNSPMSKELTNDSREDTKGNCRSPGTDTDVVNRVAIVGAGFAGLVLANYLEMNLQFFREKQENKEATGVHPKNRLWKYKLFESKSSSGIPVIGTICLHSAREILEQLCLFEEACQEENEAGPVFPKIAHNKMPSPATTTTTNDDPYHEVSREAFLKLLRKHVEIQPSSRVIDIVAVDSSNDRSLAKTNDLEYFVVIECDGGKRVKHGPFDLVVAANGLSFRGETTKALQKRLKASSSIVKIGDSRYRYGRKWWDFDFLGFKRRTSGADTAIRDGLQVGRRLLEGNAFQPTEGRNPHLQKGVGTEIPFIYSQQDRRVLCYDEVVKLVRIAIVILLPILIGLVLCN